MTAPLAGETVRTSHYPKVRVIKKAASETVTSSTTFQDDDDFSVTLEADRTYRIELRAAWTGATAGDVKTQWVVTGGVAQLTGRHCRGPALGTADSTSGSTRSSGGHGLTTSINYGTDGTNGSAVTEEFYVETTTAGTSGTLTLQWAQNGPSGTGTVMSSWSWLVITEVDLI